jgi:YbbR domain-containing protein
VVQASVDLYNLRPGKAQLPLRVFTHSGLAVVTVKPAQVEINSEALTRAKLPVTVDVRGQPADGFLAEKPRLTPGEVVIEGPADEVGRITGAQVTATVGDLQNSFSAALKVELLRADGIYSGTDVQVLPEKVTCDILVKEGYPSRLVAIASPTFVNKPPEGWKLERFELKPPEVKVFGPNRVLQTLSPLSPSAIDLGALTASVTAVPVTFKLPIDSLQLDETASVVVTISLAPVKIQRVFPGLTLVLKKSPNQHVVVSSASYTLRLEGFVEDLNRVVPSELPLVLDIRQMAPGSYPVQLQAPRGLPDRVAIVDIAPASVQVEIAESSDTGSLPVNPDGP